MRSQPPESKPSEIADGTPQMPAIPALADQGRHRALSSTVAERQAALTTCQPATGALPQSCQTVTDSARRADNLSQAAGSGGRQEGHYKGQGSSRPHSGQKGNFHQGNPHFGRSKLKGAPHGIIKLPPSERLCATPPPVWYDAAMVTLLTIEPVNEAHGMLIVEAFNRFFIDGGGQPDGDGYGDGMSNGDGYGDGFGSFGDADGGNYNKCPEAWQAE